jgi:hypothetical protein
MSMNTTVWPLLAIFRKVPATAGDTAFALPPMVVAVLELADTVVAAPVPAALLPPVVEVLLAAVPLDAANEPDH